jgi:hypothetical protein
MLSIVSGLAIPLLASTDLGWLSIFAASGSIAIFIGATVVLTVWLTGGFGGK